jgi:hypothetical protein
MKAMRHLATLCGALCMLTLSAYAAEQPIGTVVGIPAFELDGFVRANSFPPAGQPANTVTVLHNSPEFSSAIFTVSVTRRGSSVPAATIYVPTYGNGQIARIYQQINDQDVWQIFDPSDPRNPGNRYDNLMIVKLTQPSTGSYEPGVTHFLMVPSESVADVLAANPQAQVTRVHRQRAHIGAGNMVVELLALKGTSSLQIPERVYGVSLARTIAGLNANVSLRAVASTTNGAMGTIEVK